MVAAWIYQWFVDQFERKWNNTMGNESVPFAPLPPDKPVIQSPVDGSVGVGSYQRHTLHF